MKRERLGVSNPVVVLLLSVLVAFLGFSVFLLASATIIARFTGTLNGVATAIWIAIPCAALFAILSFVLAWRKLNS